MLVTLVWIGCWGEAARAASAGTAFTYQGRLIDAGSAADDLYDLTFRLYDADVGGTKVANDINVANVDVIDGHFTLELDFGSVFDGDARWLEIGVRPGVLNDPDDYTILSPRCELTPVPYALFALNSGGPADGHSLDAADGNPTDALYVDDEGKVGIGTKKPDAKLEVRLDGGSDTPGHAQAIRLGYNGLFGLRSSEDGNRLYVDHYSGGWQLPAISISRGSGNVGMGTTSPNSKLEVAGMVHSTSQGFKFPDGTTQTTAATGGGGGNTLDQAYDQGGPGAGRTITADAGAVNIAGPSGLTVSNSVGIGTASPGEKLEVVGNVKLGGAGNGVIFPDGSKQTSAASGNGSDSDWVVSGNDMYSGPSGNVGIGTTSPAEKFEVLGNVKLSGTGNGLIFPDGSKQTTAASGGTGSDYGRFGVSATLYEGTTPLADKYVNQSGDVMNGSSTEALLSVTNNAGGDCQAVYGHASGVGNVTNYGGYFLARGSKGLGVYGEATGESACGVYGHASSPGQYTSGVFGRAVSTYGYGIHGEATSDAGAGVFGQCAGGKGVFGVSTYGDGVYGESQSYAGDHAAVRGVNIGMGGGYGVYARSDLGTAVRAYGGSYDYYAAGPGWNYGPFTGAHEVTLCDDFPMDVEAGMIVSVTGRAQVRRNEDQSVSISSTLPTVKLSDTANDKAVFAVFLKEAPLPQDHWYEAKQAERFAVVNALGEGRVWVCDISGPIEAGDYITTSPIPGYGQLQDDDLLHSYTLGKAIETVDSDSVTKTIEFNGRMYKAYLIAVVYTSG